jgi:hypothetical protein
MEEVKITDMIVEYTDEEGKKSKVIIVLNETVSHNLGKFLDIDDYKEKIKNILLKQSPPMIP